MTDFIYIVGSIAFFGLMIGYVGACNSLGRADDDPTMFERQA